MYYHMKTKGILISISIKLKKVGRIKIVLKRVKKWTKEVFLLIKICRHTVKNWVLRNTP